MRAPLNHAHVQAPHSLCSSGVDWWLHTINLTHEIQCATYKYYTWRHSHTVRTCTCWHMAQWRKKWNDTEKVSYMQKTKPKATNKTRKERLKVILIVTSLTLSNCCPSLVAKMHAARSHLPHNALHSPSVILIPYWLSTGLLLYVLVSSRNYIQYQMKGSVCNTLLSFKKTHRSLKSAICATNSLWPRLAARWNGVSPHAFLRERLSVLLVRSSS